MRLAKKKSLEPRRSRTERVADLLMDVEVTENDDRTVKERQ